MAGATGGATTSVSDARRIDQRHQPGRRAAPRARLEHAGAAHGSKRRAERVGIECRNVGAFSSRSWQRRRHSMDEAQRNVKAIMESPSYILAEQYVALLAR